MSKVDVFARQGAILVTGAAGFIGSHVVEALLSRGQRVVGLDCFDAYYDPAVKRDNVVAAQAHPAYRLVEGDIRDERVVEALWQSEPIDAVIHLAARAGVRPSIEDPLLYVSVNLDGTTRLLEACRRHGTRRFVFGSSSSVYGNNAKVPFAEDDPVDEPISPYAATKRSGELIARTYQHLFGMQVACLRFFTVYGPRQRPEMAIHRFARQLRDGAVIEQFGDGSSARDYTYVADIVDGVLRALDRCAGFHIWNLGGSQTIRLDELVDLLAAKLGVSAQVRQLAMQAGDVDRTWADVDRARRELDWAPQTSIDQGLDLFLEWFMRRSGVGSQR